MESLLLKALPALHKNAKIICKYQIVFVTLQAKTNKENKTMCTTPILPSSTQMVINIDDRSIVHDIRRLLTRIQGVSSVRVHNRYYGSREFYNDLDAAEKDIANGKGVRVSSKQELDALFA